LSWILSNFEDLIGGGKKRKKKGQIWLYHLMDDHHFNHITKLRGKKRKLKKKEFKEFK